MSSPGSPQQTNYIITILGYLITFISGVTMGALINRYYIRKDRNTEKEKMERPDFLTLKTIKESVISHKPTNFNGCDCDNLIFKELVLENKTTKDIDFCEIIFEFDKESKIVKETSKCKIGLNALQKNKKKNSEIVYELRHFNRTNKVTFEFHVSSFSMNFFSAVIDKCTGIELEFIAVDIVEQPSIQPGKIISKEKIS